MVGIKLKLVAMVSLLLMVDMAMAAQIRTNRNALIGMNLGEFVRLDASDASMMPQVCVLPLANGSAGKVWYEVVRGSSLLRRPEYQMAAGADSLHHYCYAEAAKLRYYKTRDQRIKKALLKRMISEYKYMIDHPQNLPKDWPYMKLMYLEYGRALSLERNNTGAMSAFSRALQLDPAYAKAHISMADLLADLGNKSGALKQVAEGLKHNPDSKMLKNRYRDLGGQLPYPEPYVKAAETPKPENQPGQVQTDQAPVTESAQPDTPQKLEEIAPVPTSQNPGQEEQPVDGASVNPLEGGQPGEINNSHCRFCPPNQNSGQAGQPVEKDNVSPQGGAESEQKNNPYCRFCP